MKAKELLGMWVVIDLAVTNLGPSGRAAFEVVGYNADTNCTIIDAGNWGWAGPNTGDTVIKKCETYWRVRSAEITKVL